jgi:aspartyl protease family protein
MTECYRHPEKSSVVTCFECLKPVCDGCQTLDGVTTVCIPCLASRRKRRKVRNVVMAAVVVPVLGAAVFGVTLIEPPFDYGEHAPEVRRLKERVERERCDRRANIELNEKLNQAGDHRGALDSAALFFEQCGDLPRLRWTTYTAHKSLSEFPQAAAEASKLIDSRPEDQDFWWWRGEVYAMAGQWDKAAPDFKQCMTLLPKARYCPFDLAKAYEELGRPCDAIFPIEHYLHMHPDQRKSVKVKARLARLQQKGGCKERASEGRVEIPFHPETGGIFTKATINGVEGRFLVDTGASLVTVTKKFGRRLSLAGDSERTLLVKSAAGIHTARAAVADSVKVGGVEAKRVEVAVMEEMLDDDLDGVLGLSFLSRFSTEIDYAKERVVIEAR